MDTQFVQFQTAKVEPEESVIKLPPIPLPSAAAFVYSRSEPQTQNSSDAPFVFSRTTPTEETEQPATEESSSYKNTILVNKSNQTVTVYDKDGKSIFNAPVSTGKVSGQKQKVGDNRTPEGTFKISGYENYKGDKYKIQKFNSEEAIRLNTPGWTGILFHGDANEPQYLGKQGSSEGCIRMSKEQLSKMLDLIGRDSVKNYNVVISAKEGTKIPKIFKMKHLNIYKYWENI